MANIAVRELETARKFYEDTLGLKVVDKEDGEVVVMQSGSTKIFVYRSQYAGTNKATAMSWEVGDGVDSVVKALKSKGVKFEHYKDMPGMTLKGDVHEAGDMKVAWFKDPDGNILSVVGR